MRRKILALLLLSFIFTGCSNAESNKMDTTVLKTNEGTSSDVSSEEVPFVTGNPGEDSVKKDTREFDFISEIKVKEDGILLFDKEFSEKISVMHYTGNEIIYSIDTMASNGNIDAADSAIYLYEIDSGKTTHIVTIKNTRYSSGDVVLRDNVFWYTITAQDNEGKETLYLLSLNLTSGNGQKKKITGSNFPLMEMEIISDKIYTLQRNENRNGDMEYRINEMDIALKENIVIDEVKRFDKNRDCIIDICSDKSTLYGLYSINDKRFIKGNDEQKTEYQLNVEEFLKLPESYDTESDYLLTIEKRGDYVALETGEARATIVKLENGKAIEIGVPDEFTNIDKGTRMVSCQLENFLAFGEFAGNDIYLFDSQKEEFYLYEINLPDDYVMHTLVGKDGSILVKLLAADDTVSWYQIPREAVFKGL